MKRGAALLALTLLLPGCGKDKAWKPGAEVPGISLQDLGGRIVKLSDFRGRPVVLRFWATGGCHECAASMAELNDYIRNNQGKDLAVLAVNQGNSQAEVEAFAGEAKLSYPLFLDPARMASAAYGVDTLPATFFIDRNGMARESVESEITRERFDRIMVELEDLAQPRE